MIPKEKAEIACDAFSGQCESVEMMKTGHVIFGKGISFWKTMFDLFDSVIDKKGFKHFPSYVVDMESTTTTSFQVNYFQVKAPIGKSSPKLFSPQGCRFTQFLYLLGI